MPDVDSSMMRKISQLLGIVASIAFGAVAACQRSRVLDVMKVPAQCDSAPPPVFPGERLGGTVPHEVAATADSGAVIGVVTEAGTGRVLPSSGVSLIRGEGTERTVVGSETFTDSLGAFVLGPASPGRYTLRVRKLQHVLMERSIELHAGTVDTVRVAMQYFRCVGY